MRRLPQLVLDSDPSPIPSPCLPPDPPPDDDTQSPFPFYSRQPNCPESAKALALALAATDNDDSDTDPDLDASLAFPGGAMDPRRPWAACGPAGAPPTHTPPRGGVPGLRREDSDGFVPYRPPFIASAISLSPPVQPSGATGIGMAPAPVHPSGSGAEASTSEKRPRRNLFTGWWGARKERKRQRQQAKLASESTPALISGQRAPPSMSTASLATGAAYPHGQGSLGHGASAHYGQQGQYGSVGSYNAYGQPRRPFNMNVNRNNSIKASPSVLTGLSAPRMLFSPLSRGLRPSGSDNNLRRNSPYASTPNLTPQAPQQQHFNAPYVSPTEYPHGRPYPRIGANASSATLPAQRTRWPGASSVTLHSEGSRSRLAVSTMCDALTFPKPRMNAHDITPPDSPEGHESDVDDNDDARSQFERAIERSEARDAERDDWAERSRPRSFRRPSSECAPSITGTPLRSGAASRFTATPSHHRSQSTSGSVRSFFTLSRNGTYKGRKSQSHDNLPMYGSSTGHESSQAASRSGRSNSVRTRRSNSNTSRLGSRIGGGSSQTIVHIPKSTSSQSLFDDTGRVPVTPKRSQSSRSHPRSSRYSNLTRSNPDLPRSLRSGGTGSIPASPPLPPSALRHWPAGPPRTIQFRPGQQPGPGRPAPGVVVIGSTTTRTSHIGHTRTIDFAEPANQTHGAAPSTPPSQSLLLSHTTPSGSGHLQFVEPRRSPSPPSPPPKIPTPPRSSPFTYEPGVNEGEIGLAITTDGYLAAEPAQTRLPFDTPPGARPPGIKEDPSSAHARYLLARQHRRNVTMRAFQSPPMSPSRKQTPPIIPMALPAESSDVGHAPPHMQRPDVPTPRRQASMAAREQADEQPAQTPLPPGQRSRTRLSFFGSPRDRPTSTSTLSPRLTPTPSLRIKTSPQKTTISLADVSAVPIAQAPQHSASGTTTPVRRPSTQAPSTAPGRIPPLRAPPARPVPPTPPFPPHSRSGSITTLSDTSTGHNTPGSMTPALPSLTSVLPLVPLTALPTPSTSVTSLPTPTTAGQTGSRRELPPTPLGAFAARPPPQTSGPSTPTTEKATFMDESPTPLRHGTTVAALAPLTGLGMASPTPAHARSDEERMVTPPPDALPTIMDDSPTPVRQTRVSVLAPAASPTPAGLVSSTASSLSAGSAPRSSSFSPLSAAIPSRNTGTPEFPSLPSLRSLRSMRNAASSPLESDQSFRSARSRRTIPSASNVFRSPSALSQADVDIEQGTELMRTHSNTSSISLYSNNETDSIAYATADQMADAEDEMDSDAFSEATLPDLFPPPQSPLSHYASAEEGSIGGWEEDLFSQPPRIDRMERIERIERLEPIEAIEEEPSTIGTMSSSHHSAHSSVTPPTCTRPLPSTPSPDDDHRATVMADSAGRSEILGSASSLTPRARGRRSRESGSSEEVFEFEQRDRRSSSVSLSSGSETSIRPSLDSDFRNLFFRTPRVTSPSVGTTDRRDPVTPLTIARKLPGTEEVEEEEGQQRDQGGSEQRNSAFGLGFGPSLTSLALSAPRDRAGSVGTNFEIQTPHMGGSDSRSPSALHQSTVPSALAPPSPALPSGHGLEMTFVGQHTATSSGSSLDLMPPSAPASSVPQDASWITKSFRMSQHMRGGSQGSIGGGQPQIQTQTSAAAGSNKRASQGDHAVFSPTTFGVATFDNPSTTSTTPHSLAGTPRRSGSDTHSSDSHLTPVSPKVIDRFPSPPTHTGRGF